MQRDEVEWVAGGKMTKILVDSESVLNFTMGDGSSLGGFQLRNDVLWIMF